MAKENPSVRLTFNMLNIKLRMAKAEEASQDAYTSLFTGLNAARIRVRVTPNVGVIMKRCIIDRVGNNVVVYGVITRYTPVDGEKLLNLLNPDEDEGTPGLPSNLVPNPRDTAFYFTPANHRLALRKTR